MLRHQPYDKTTDARSPGVGGKPRAEEALGGRLCRFWVLETVARIPYFAYISMLHLYETLGWWRAGASLRKVGARCPCLPAEQRSIMHSHFMQCHRWTSSEVAMSRSWIKAGVSEYLKLEST